jgi:hypothetical protein
MEEGLELDFDGELVGESFFDDAFEGHLDFAVVRTPGVKMLIVVSCR